MTLRSLSGGSWFWLSRWLFRLVFRSSSSPLHILPFLAYDVYLLGLVPCRILMPLCHCLPPSKVCYDFLFPSPTTFPYAGHLSYIYGRYGQMLKDVL